MLLTFFTRIVAAPFMILFSRKSCTEDPRHYLKRRTANLPKSRSKRSKDVSLSYDPVINTSSHLLARLPLELRRQIYAYVLGNQVVHILLTPTRIAHVCCASPTHTDFSRTCYPRARQLFVPEPVPIPPSDIAIGLLLSCRQIYAEALPILYSLNTFDFDDLSAFNLFAKNISPSGLSSIKSLHLKWFAGYPPLQFAQTKSPTSAPGDDATYLQFWHVLASQMPALTELRMAIVGSVWVWRLGLQDPWVQPVKQVKGLDVFDLEIVEPLYNYSSKEQTEVFASGLRSIVCRRTE